MIPPDALFTITQKQVTGAVLAVLLPALSWTGVDYVRTRDTVHGVKAQADRLELDVRDIRKDTLRMLVLMNRQFVGDDAEIARLTAELNAMKAKEAK